MGKKLNNPEHWIELDIFFVSSPGRPFEESSQTTLFKETGEF
jgi:hypothetical protein